MLPTIRELKRKTADYWQAIQSNGWEEYLSRSIPVNYLESGLLNDELTYAGQLERLPNRKCTNLVFLAGYSLEPLLQLVKVYEPQKVFLLMNEDYGRQSGLDYGNAVKDLLISHGLVNDCSTNYDLLGNNLGGLDPDEPVGVFKTLLKYYNRISGQAVNGNADHEENQPISLVVDITGAKKRMIAGAYLFGAYIQTAISYVDFEPVRDIDGTPIEPYDFIIGRPYGFCCHPILLDNPVEFFKFTDWNRVKNYYEQYAFKSCGNVLDDILKAFEASAIFSGEEKQGIQLMRGIMDVYELWDNNHYSQAKKVIGMSPVICTTHPKLPLAIELLGTDWPGTDNQLSIMKQFLRLEWNPDNDKSIYRELDRLLVYARDEYTRIGRLIELAQDYRSALLRAAGLYEFLLKARVIAWCYQMTNNESISSKVLVFDSNGNIVDNPSHYILRIHKYLTREAMANAFVALLNKKPIEIRDNKDGENKPLINFQIIDKEILKIVDSLKWASLEKQWSKQNKEILKQATLADLRNKTIHSCLPIDRSLAEQARESVWYNLKNFEDWIERINPELINSLVTLEGTEGYCNMPWRELIRICSLDELLPENMNSDQREEC